MRTHIAFALFALLIAAPVSAQVRQFPYEAVVQGDDVYVRSGPGQSYYATLKLELGDRVTVHRHDPGGWYMIAPPPGSFSLIDASLVQKTGETEGIVQVPPIDNGQAGRAIVRIGSEFGDDHDFYGRELSSGDAVEIIGEKTIETERGSVLMYQIQPPALEYRWVKGDYIVPAADALREEHDLDPFAVPAAQKQQVVAEAEPAFTLDAEPIVAADPVEAPVGAVAEQIAAVDRQFQDMLALDPEEWQLDSFEQAYQTLFDSAEGANAVIIQQRLSTIQSRRTVQQQYLEFLELTEATTRRDQQLLSMQNGRTTTTPTAYPRPTPAVGANPSGPTPTPAAAPGTRPTAQPASQPEGTTPGPTLGPIEPIPEEELPEQNAPGVAPRFDGAGIIRRNNNQFGFAPQYVLVAPDGRFLAYLDQLQNVDLAPYVGHAMGITGQRGFDPRLNADRIAVRRLTPVQLAPSTQPRR
jgi:hypothetical protein